MYKGASQSLQRQHAVDKPHPSRGYIDTSAPLDVLPDPTTLSLEQLRAEQKQLRLEMQRIETDLLVAKAERRSGTTLDAIGQRKAAHQHRLAMVNKAFYAKDNGNELARLKQAVREIADDELAGRIFAKAKEGRLP